MSEYLGPGTALVLAGREIAARLGVESAPEVAGDGPVIGLLKRLRSRLDEILAALPADGGRVAVREEVLNDYFASMLSAGAGLASLPFVPPMREIAIENLGPQDVAVRISGGGEIVRKKGTGFSFDNHEITSVAWRALGGAATVQVLARRRI